MIEANTKLKEERMHRQAAVNATTKKTSPQLPEKTGLKLDEAKNEQQRRGRGGLHR